MSEDLIIITEAITDDTEAYEFKMVYVQNQSSYMYFIEKETNKTTESKINLKEYTPENIDSLNDNDNAYKVMKYWIKSKLTINGDYTDSEEESRQICKDLIESIKYLGTEDESFRLDLLTGETNETIQKAIQKCADISIKREFTEQEEKIKHNLEHRRNIGKTRQSLGDYLNRKGIILRENTHHIYYLDKESNGYSAVTTDEIIKALSRIFGKNIICDDDVETAISFISDRLTPTYNIAKLGNCLYSMDSHEVIESVEPVFTLIETKYNYNPQAKSRYVKDFLYSSLARFNPSGDLDEEETAKAVKGFLQLVGYCFVSGNPKQSLPFLTGVGGGGKSVASNLIISIFGINRVGDAKLKDIELGGFGTSQLVNKIVNLVRDSDNKPIEDEGMIRQITGSDDFTVEEKYKNPYTLPKEELPTVIVVCNNPPIFKNIGVPTLERMGFIEFKVKFRGTEREDKDLEKKIMSNPEELEWLIYNGLEAYKEMVLNNEPFAFNLDSKTTLEIFNKHSNPVNYLVRKLILKFDPEAYDSEIHMLQNQDAYIPTNELNDLCVLLANKEGIEIPLDNNGRIPPRQLLNAIKKEFDLFDYVNMETGKMYSTTTERINNKSTRVYPDLIKTDSYSDLLSEMKNC